MGDLVNMDTRGSLEFLGSLLAAAPAIISRLDDNFIVRYVNQVREGYSIDQVVGSSVFNLLSDENAIVARAVYQDVLRTGQPGQYQLQVVRPSGEVATYQTFVTRVNAANGRFGLCLVLVEITEVVASRQKLARSEEKLRVALDATQIALWSWDIATGEVTWDERMHAISQRAEPLNFLRWLDQVVHPDDQAKTRARFANVAAGGSFTPVVQRILLPEGGIRYVLVTGTAQRDDKGALVRIVGGLLDVTEQQLLQEQLVRAQRMDAVGNLTAGIAHNFNNMLMIIQSCLSVLERRVAEVDKPWTRDALVAAERAAEVISQLMSFTGQRRGHAPQDFSIAGICNEATSICRRTIDKHIEIVCDVQTDATVRSGPGEIDQVLMNLLLNARDAVAASPSRATPRIELRARDAGPGQVCIEVADNGVGMPSEVLARIYEPFFSTKHDKGTGLGLASSHSIVHRLGGQLQCSSTPGEGTTFRVLLPSSDATSIVTENKLKPSSAGTGRVLIIDDEEAIRRVVSEQLDADGIHSHGVSSVAEARQLLDQESNYDLILLDRSMPGVPGASFVGELRERLPSSKIFFFTGHDVVASETQMVDGVIHKPVSGPSLVQAVRTALAH